MKLAICDDDMVVCDRLETIVNNYCMEHHIDLQCDSFVDGYDFANHIEYMESFDIYLLDIEMRKIDGFKIARLIRKVNEHAIIIFVTSHREKMQEAFEVLAFQYIVKPFEDSEVRRIIEKAIAYVGRNKRCFFFKTRKAINSIRMENIQYFESRRRKIIICTLTEQEECYMNLKEVLEQLDARNFVQIHTSFIVNMNEIRTKESNEIKLYSGVILPISKKYTESFNESYREYVRMRTGK
ncbi:MAG: LytTR family DNA-binding domain-containing protein [Lachnospiraceae bacterium]|nr:LytTR family DNA-binding domain-containing protein [Lachnospiraceae bacterium]